MRQSFLCCCINSSLGFFSYIRYCFQSHINNNSIAVDISLLSLRRLFNIKVNGYNPFDYLRALFENIRATKSQQDFSKLLPFNLKQMPT
ncbi:transposase domain-containing protein [Legionella norrlandica]|uniref:transposase domain-containing protein n=1 Tax=Legionella norrlandica TaxID=1498499 RepID=UPI001269C66F